MKVISVDPANCTGCRACELACSLFHTGECRPSRSNIHIMKKENIGINVPVLCMQCSDAPCAKVCPKKALYEDEKSGWILLKEDLCTGCRLCHVACPLGVIQFPQEKRKAMKCDMCDGNPQCVMYCESEALQVVDSEDLFRPKSTKILDAFSSGKNQNVKKNPSAGEVRI